MEPIISYFFELNTSLQILCLVLAGSFAFQLFYYLFFYARIFGFSAKASQKHNHMPLSVIICARNEGNNLKGFLESVLRQNYPKFQTIVVNDASEDHTVAVLNEYKKKYPDLYVTHLENNKQFPHGKKLALTVGIKAAEYPHMVFTDADCRPDSSLWLQSIADSYNNEKTKIVTAYGGYIKRQGLLNKLIRFDTLFIALQYLSFAKAGLPYMGVGRNLSYTKEIYESVKGFSSHYHLLSGDDDLFVNQAATKENTAICTNKESIIRSVPKYKFKDLLNQKRRHLSTGKYYKTKHKILLTLEPLSRMLFYTAFITLAVIGLWPWFIWGIFAFRFIIQSAVMLKATGLMGEKDLRFFIIFFDIFIPLLNIWSFYSKFLIKNRINQQW